MVSSNYVLNSSLNNTLFAIPLNTSVSFNASGAYFNPSTGSNDYQCNDMSESVITGVFALENVILTVWLDVGVGM